MRRIMIDETLEINIKESPPTQEVLDRLRAKASKRGAWKVRIFSVSCFLTATLLTAINIAIPDFPTIILGLPILAFIFAVTGLYFTVFLLVFRLVPPDLERFNKLNDNQVIEYDKIINNHPEIKDYYRKINTMGRDPVLVDLEVAREWMDKIPERKKRKQVELARERMYAIR